MEEYLNKWMTYEEVAALIMHIRTERQPCAQGKWIKHVSPRFDMRTGLCYMVSLTEWDGEETVIHTQNECATLKDSLYKRCPNSNVTTQYRFGKGGNISTTMVEGAPNE